MIKVNADYVKRNKLSERQIEKLVRHGQAKFHVLEEASSLAPLTITLEKREGSENHHPVIYSEVVGTELKYYHDDIEGFVHYLVNCFIVCQHWTVNA